MSEAYAWFKFNCASWMMGRIRRLSFAHQGAFIGLCSVYWTKFGEVTLEDAEIECTEDLLPELLKTKIVKVDGDKICIAFLDEQLNEAKDKSKQSKQAAKVRWDNARNATALQPHSERNAERETERKKEERVVPSLSDVVSFFSENGYTEDHAKTAFEYYTSTDWHDKNKQDIVTRWKFQVRQNWFKDEGKKSDKPKFKNLAEFIEAQNGMDTP